MEEIDLYNQLSILHDELGHLKILSDNNNFYQCFAEDEDINNELSKALEKIELGKQFAFYNLGISKEDQELLSNIEILGNENKVIRSEECKYFNHCILNVVEKTIAKKALQPPITSSYKCLRFFVIDIFIDIFSIQLYTKDIMNLLHIYDYHYPQQIGQHQQMNLTIPLL